MEVIINEDESNVVIFREWLNKEKSSKLFDFLIKNCDFIQQYASYDGKEFKIPRKQFFCGDNTDKIHKYKSNSSLGSKLNEWIPEIKDIRDRIHKEFNIYLDSCLINYYENGNDYISYHSDRETKPPMQFVATVSLGVTRNFYFRSKNKFLQNGKLKYKLIKLQLNSGDLVLMYGRTQELWNHSIIKQPNITESRISITLRELV